MLVVISNLEFASFSHDTRSEILSKLNERDGVKTPSHSAPSLDEDYNGIEMENVAELTFKQVQTWMEAASDNTKKGLRLFADHGRVITQQMLLDAGITNTSHFQSRTTIRTRTITGDKGAFLMGWDDWLKAEDGEGRYAVTQITYQSLRRYFKLE